MQKSKKMGKLINLDDASKLLGVCKDTLRRMDRKGIINVIMTTGGHRRYDEDEIIRYRNLNTKVKEKQTVKIEQQRELTQQEKDAMEIRSFVKDEKTLNERIKLEKFRNKAFLRERLSKVMERIIKYEKLKKQLEKELEDGINTKF